VFGIQASDGRQAGQDFINSLRLFSHVANVGMSPFFSPSL
jgi:hypothetical protein